MDFGFLIIKKLLEFLWIDARLKRGGKGHHFEGCYRFRFLNSQGLFQRLVDMFLERQIPESGLSTEFFGNVGIKGWVILMEAC
jgi:hypothetical protein